VASPRFIAEIGSNHNRDRGRCLELVDAAADAGCRAVKLQIFTVEDLFSPEALAAKPELLGRRAWEFPMELLPDVRARCTERGLELGAAAFGLWAVSKLAEHVDFLKVASYEVLWHDLVRACSDTGLPLILSTGMATLEEVGAAVAVARAAGVRDLRLLHCVSGYPTPLDEANLRAIETLRERFECPVGWSDHTDDARVVRRAVNRWGASDIEVHIDLDGDGYEAGAHCWTPDSLRRLIGELREVPDDDLGRLAQAVDGDGIKRPMPVEMPDVAWRADPTDGLRPLRSTRRLLAA
jgi:sialic acid synthase SpsE